MNATAAAIRYLTGCSNAGVLAVAHEYQIGLMAQPNNGYARQIPNWPSYAADNGCFSPRTARRFDLTRYLRWLDERPRERCLFAVAPDVLYDHAATLARSLPVLPQLRALGYRAAFVAQDGITSETTPWAELDTLFIGGSDPFKAAGSTWALMREARARGKHVHQGRVNTMGRFIASHIMACDTADGTYLGYGPDKNLPLLLRWIRQTRLQPALEFTA